MPRFGFLPTLILLSFVSESTSLSLRPLSVGLAATISSNASVNEKSDNQEQQRQQQHQKPSTWIGRTGETALASVQYLASKVAESDASVDGFAKSVTKEGSINVSGTGGTVYNNANFNTQKAESQESSILRPNLKIASNMKRQDQVWTALANLELDMQLLDNLAAQKPQLSALELSLLTASIAATASSPFAFNGALAEVLPPTAAAFCAAIGIGAEYVGRVAVADGKEVAASTIQCAAEAEGLLANAERAKAITPLCVGVSATAATLSLLVPVLLNNIEQTIINEIYLACPLASVLSAAVSSLALQETKLFSQRATSVGNRRFARSGLVGRTWLSAAEQIIGKSNSSVAKWRTFCLNVLPAPILGSMIPGTTIATKSIIVTALAAAQTAFFLAQCEYSLARATDAVAVKARSAAVCDTYANQGARSASILPFTSALSAFCAAATAAIVELPFVESLSASGTAVGLISEMAIIAVFPAFSALFAAAASVSKARCEVQTEAAVQAASTLALEYNGSDDDDPILRPFRGVIELIQLTYQSSIVEPIQVIFRRLRWRFLNIFRSKKNSDGSSGTSTSPTPATP